MMKQDAPKTRAKCRHVRAQRRCAPGPQDV